VERRSPSRNRSALLTAAASAARRRPGEQAEVLENPARALALICETKPVSASGRWQAYHALTGGFVLGEVVQRVGAHHRPPLHAIPPR
jgi:hypothetical protein